MARSQLDARWFGMTAALLAGAAAPAKAQMPAVVQLPSFSTFGVSTTVSVPDRGSMSLGGVGRSSMGSTAFGSPLGPGNRSFGRSLGGSAASVRATIHDLDALDRATLRRANANPSRPRAGQAGRSAARDADLARRRLAVIRQSSAGQVPAGSVAEARRQRAAEAATGQAEAVQNVKRAHQAAAAGKTNVAALFYNLAAKQAVGALKSQIDKEAAIFARDATASTHQATPRSLRP